MATLTFVYSDSTAVVGPLATTREPHSWDLCAEHAGRITAPRGWDLVRHSGSFDAESTDPDEDDLVALADAVREGCGGSGPRYRAGGTTVAGFSEPQLNVAGVPAATPETVAVAERRSARRRGHLRVLPDPAD